MRNTPLPKLGLRGPTPPEKSRLKIVPEHLAALGPTPPHVDYYRGVRWPMYANDKIGDCTIAAAAHIIGSTSKHVTGKTATLRRPSIIKAYSAVSNYDPKTGANDNGAYIGDVMSYWRHTGIGKHRILAYAQLINLDLDFVRRAIYAFDAVEIAVTLPHSTYYNGYGSGSPWRTPTSGPMIGAHAINLVGYDRPKDNGHDGDFFGVTWGTTQRIGADWLEANMYEAWVAITPEWFNAKGRNPIGVNTKALGIELRALTGTDPLH